MKNYGMGNWKKKKLIKGIRASRTRSDKAKIYYAIPPVSGWKGGVPNDNGSKKK